MELFQSKSILARLLAQENISVNHAAVSTASFDLDKRALTLPIWKDMSGDIYDLLCGHEVGHALETPFDGWHGAIFDSKSKKYDMALKGYLNVLEDARIEKKIKKRFPGLRGSFLRGYQELFERDLFGLKKNNIKIEDCILIDRINLHFKLGNLAVVPFDDEEKAIVTRVENLETWDEVEALARELVIREKEKQQEEARSLKYQKQASGEGDPDESLDEEQDQEVKKSNDTDIEIESITDKEFRELEKSLVDTKARSYQYVVLPDYKIKDFVIPFKTVLQQFKFDDPQIAKNESLRVRKEFKAKNDRFISQLIKEFEMKRNAQQQARAKISKSGELDLKKVFSYQINEDLFRRFTTMPKGKNHGLLMFFDMSGSMQGVYGSVIEQLLVLVEFCRRTNIKFEVYGFTNRLREEVNQRALEDFRDVKVEGQMQIADANFVVRQYFTDAMSAREYTSMVDNMLLVKAINENRSARYNTMNPLNQLSMPAQEHLSGTPLNQSIMIAHSIHANFVARTKAEIVNMAWLTDGQSDNAIYHCHKDSYTGKLSEYQIGSPDRFNIVLRHEKTKHEVKIKAHDRKGTQALITLLRKITGSNVVCFDLVDGAGKRHFNELLYSYRETLVAENIKNIERLCSEFRRNKIAIVEGAGYNEHYVIPGSKETLEITDEELEVDPNDKRKILNAFMDLQDKKRSSRILLNRFVNMIS